MACLQGISVVKSAEIMKAEGGELAVRAYPESKESPIAEMIMSTLTGHNFKIKSLLVEQGRLDEVFRTITTKETDS